jgi:putative endonuclease
MPACHAGGREFESRPVRFNHPTFGDAILQRFFYFIKMIYHVYIIQSLLDRSYYIGYTRNLERRIYHHNHDKTGYTSRKAPWNLVYSESYETKTLAIKREQFLKNQKNREFIGQLISGLI